VFLQQLVNGIILGSAYGLIAIGLTMVFGIMNVSNFAYGTIYMLGGYFMYLLSMLSGLPFFLAIAGSMIAVGVLGIAMERIVFRPVYEAPHLNSLLVSLGLLIFLENVVLVLCGPKTLSVKGPYTEVILSLFSISVTLQRVVILAASIVLISAFYIFLNFTLTGKSMMATAQNPRGASLVGISPSKVYVTTFAISSTLAAAGGALLSPIFYVYPTMGNTPLIKAFVVVVLGGMGNVHGAVIGGFIVGIAESLGAAYISSDYKSAYSLIILIVVLLTRSQGLFGKSVK
jgi:branched-chain amino acid transport system permease protein